MVNRKVKERKEINDPKRNTFVLIVKTKQAARQPKLRLNNSDQYKKAQPREFISIEGSVASAVAQTELCRLVYDDYRINVPNTLYLA